MGTSACLPERVRANARMPRVFAAIQTLKDNEGSKYR